MFCFLFSQQVATRVQEGGHHIPKPVIYRRYHAGLKNFFQLYQPEVDEWRFSVNEDFPYLIAQSVVPYITVNDISLWETLKRTYDGD